ncbi:hypothetical protein [Shewanella psychromarinicola]|uniref:hypothetical protein n=1 Tax=Shewanella psychromarinicola TaxID=2487742 RepID=UPI003F4BE285
MKLTTALLVVFALILQGLTSSSMATNSTLACHENSQVSMSTAWAMLQHLMKPAPVPAIAMITKHL